MSLMYGIELGWISPIRPLLTSENTPVGTKPLSLDTVAWLGSISFLGSLSGTLIWSVVVDRFGRKVAAALVAAFYITCWTLIITAEHVKWLLVARFISGIASCGTKSTVTAYISEMSDDTMRGFFGSFPILFIDVGVMISYTVGTYFKYYGIAAVGLVIPIVFLITFVWLPESPVFLWKTGKIVEAEKSLLWYRGGDYSVVEKSLLSYKLFPKNEKRSLYALIATKGTRKALIIALSLAFAVQTSGYYIIISYAVSIFESSSGTTLSPYESAILIHSVPLVFSFITSLVIDRLGRRFLLVTAEAVMTLTLFCLGYHFFSLDDQSADSPLRWAPVVLLSLHLAAHGLKAPAAYTLKAEVFPPEVKGLALSLMVLTGSLLSFTTVRLFPSARALLQLHGCFWILSGCSLFFAIFFSFYIPETKRKPHSVILMQLNGGDLEASGKDRKPCSGVTYAGLRNLRRSPSPQV